MEWGVQNRIIDKTKGNRPVAHHLTIRLNKLNHFIKNIFRLLIRDLARPDNLVPTAAIFEHQGTDVDCRGPVDDTVADRKGNVFAVFSIHHADRDIGFRVKGINQETI